jgi:glycosyltransferase involved in cell wall biosynthesis
MLPRSRLVAQVDEGVVSGRVAAGRNRNLRVAVVGVSIDESCGVRDYASGLAPALAREGVDCSLHWLNRVDLTLRGGRKEIRAGMADLAGELAERQLDAIILHYSVFSFAYRGVPLFATPVLATLRRTHAPLLTVLHELAYSWGPGGVRGSVWALTQRAALIDVVRRSAALMVTTEQRGHWLASRAWLPSRPTATAPVFSNLPPVSGRDVPVKATVGLFGYSHDGSDPGLVLDTLRMLREGGTPTRLLLLGAPGADSSAGRRWRSAADARGLIDAIAFTGILAPTALSAALASCEVLLFADSAGPTSRKTTLAAMLASARPVLALDGPDSWEPLVQARAVLIAKPHTDELAGAMRRLLSDEQERAALAARGRRFYEQTMSADHSVRAVLGLLNQIVEPATAPPRDSQVARAAS